MADLQLTLVRSGQRGHDRRQLMLGGDPQIATAASQVFAFSFPTLALADPALLVILSPTTTP
jgi:hypothetical protein